MANSFHIHRFHVNKSGSGFGVIARRSGVVINKLKNEKNDGGVLFSHDDFLKFANIVQDVATKLREEIDATN